MSIILSNGDAEKAARAREYLQVHNLPINIDARVTAFVARPCGACGGHEWMIGEDGLLVCPCILAKQDEQPVRPRVEQPVQASSRDAWDNRAEYSVGKKKRKTA